MYSMMIIVNNTILHILKFLREYIYIYFVLFCFFWLCGLWDLSSLITD